MAWIAERISERASSRLGAGLVLALLLLVGVVGSGTAQTNVSTGCFRGLSEISVANLDQSGFAKLTRNNPADRSPAWSPDSARIAFERAGKVFTMRADGSAMVQLTNERAAADHSPDWSPDGTRIAFERAGDIYVMNADGRSQVQLTNTRTVAEHSPDWSPDGTRITFERAGDIYVMNADGGGPTNLTSSSFVENSPVWSPDGAKIAFTRIVEFRQGVFVMNADGRGQTDLSNGWTGYWPAWSPDGRRLAFTSFGPAKIIIMNADGSEKTEFMRDGYEPAWSPDSTRIAFALVPSSHGVGAARCRVPRVVGLRLASARMRIRRANCGLGRTRFAQSVKPRKRVIDQEPRPGAVRHRGWCVDLMVSRGRK